MYIARRSKYFDLVVCSVYGIFLLLWYYSRCEIFQKISEKQKEKKEAVAYINSLKEELKIVFQHTEHLEKSLKEEQQNHRDRYNELHSRDGLYYMNISKVESELVNALKETDSVYQSYHTENVNIKRNHIEMYQRFFRVNEDFNLLMGKSEEDLQSLRQSSEMTMLSLNDRVEDLLSQKKYYQKLSKQYNEDYTSTLKKLTQCYKALNSSGIDAKENKKSKKVREKIVEEKTYLSDQENSDNLDKNLNLGRTKRNYMQLGKK